MGFSGALFHEVSPCDSKQNPAINQIVGPKTIKSKIIKIPNGKTGTHGLIGAPRPTRTAIDSGACDSIIPPTAFPNTVIDKSNDIGKIYGACGGEGVTNLGEKAVEFITKEGIISKITYQIGDKITRPLTAVSQLAAQGKGVWFGPAPAYESFIVDDPNAFVAYNGNKINIDLCNGVYELEVKELFPDPCMDVGGIDDDADLSAEPEIFMDDARLPQSMSTGNSSSSNNNSNSNNATNQQQNSNEESANNAEPSMRIAQPSAPIHDSRNIHPVEIPGTYSENPNIQIKCSPCMPSKADIEKHNAAGHLPYRNWCPICVWGRGKEDAHKRSEEHSELPLFICDYCFLTSKPEEGAENREVDEKITIFVIKEHNSKMLFSSVVPRKGLETEIAVHFSFKA